jgi:hypothetical protein
MSEDKKDEGTAFADTRDSPLLGNDEKPTTDPQEFFERREERKKKLLEAEDKGSGGAQPATIEPLPSDIPHDSYMFYEVQRALHPKKVAKEDSNPNPSPANE